MGKNKSHPKNNKANNAPGIFWCFCQGKNFNPGGGAGKTPVVSGGTQTPPQTINPPLDPGVLSHRSHPRPSTKPPQVCFWWKKEPSPGKVVDWVGFVSARAGGTGGGDPGLGGKHKAVSNKGWWTKKKVEAKKKKTTPPTQKQ